jgi:leucyl aminopeptidase
MKITVDAAKPSELDADLVLVPLARGDKKTAELPAQLRPLDKHAGGRIAELLDHGDFRARSGETLPLFLDRKSKPRRLLLLGLGDAKKLDAEVLRNAAGSAISAARTHRSKRPALVIPAAGELAGEALAQVLTEGAVLGAYRFERYRSAAGDDENSPIQSLTLVAERVAEVVSLRRGAERGAILAECQNLTRDLSNLPANDLPPAELARRAQAVAREVGLRARVLDVPALRRKQMGAILAVGGGSAHPPRLVTLEHTPKGAVAKRDAAPICLVGKGITFDSGGISIKPAAGMDEMKHDMSGAAAVIGALRACALLKLPRRVVGVIGAAENMPSGTAYRPGDIVTSMSGKTIEVLNTDAEGRVVLADALHYARTEFEPAAIIDLATLTGACIVALGKLASGLFSNHDALAEHVRKAGEATGERAWPMPLWEGHRTLVKSAVADLKNSGGRDAGSSTAAAFLQAFAGDTPWVHLDIAGTGWTTTASGYQPKGATGVGVRLLLEALRNWDESGV